MAFILEAANALNPRTIPAAERKSAPRTLGDFFECNMSVKVSLPLEEDHLLPKVPTEVPTKTTRIQVRII
jgi:hypothetical protein